MASDGSSPPLPLRRSELGHGLHPRRRHDEAAGLPTDVVTVRVSSDSAMLE